MKVKELMKMLGELDPEADVLLMSQPHWPFEYSVCGVTTREELEDESGQGAPTDVFLVEGQQLRYGSRAAWDVASRE